MISDPELRTVVSVVIPTYNHCDYVLQAIRSVQEQTVKNVQIIVVNDGSPDSTETTLKPLVDSKEITYLYQRNAGQAAARNRGLAIATGEFIALLDDDDLWPPDHLQWQVEALRTSPDAVMVYGTLQKSTATGPEPPGGEPSPIQGFNHFATRCPLVSPGQALFRASAIHAVGGLDVNLRGTDDWDLYIRLARLGPVLFQSRLALNYRVHANNASKNYQRMFANGMQVVEKHFPAGKSDSRVRREAIAFVRQMAAQIGISEVIALRHQGKRLDMLATLLKVIRIRPALLLPNGLIRRLQFVIGR